MKNFLFLSVLAIGLAYVYNVYASSPAVRAAGCTDEDCYACQVWQVTPNGAGMILERGKNIVIWDEEDGSNEG